MLQAATRPFYLFNARCLEWSRSCVLSSKKTESSVIRNPEYDPSTADYIGAMGHPAALACVLPCTFKSRTVLISSSAVNPTMLNRT